MRRRLAGSYVSSVVSISLVLFMVGVSTLLVVNAKRVSDWFRESMQASVILRQEVGEDEAEEYRAAISSLPFVRASRVVSREEGIREMQEMLGEDFMDVFTSAPVPVSVAVSLKAEYVCADSMAVVREALASPMVEEVECQQPLVDTLNANMRRISLVAAAIILVLLFISFALICNTVRLDVYSRRFTINTMKLVGAKKSFIRAPFVGRAVLQGLAAAVVSLAMVAGLVWLVWRRFPALGEVFGWECMLPVAAVVVAAGVAICVVSTFFVVGRLVSLRRDKLYF